MNILNNIDDLIEETEILQERYDTVAAYGAGLGLITTTGIWNPFGKSFKLFDDTINNSVTTVLDPVGKGIAAAIKSVADHLDSSVINKIANVLADDTSSSVLGGAVLAIGGLAAWNKVQGKIRDRKVKEKMKEVVMQYHRDVHAGNLNEYP
jgi:hypothetical protein